jgi:hypothetical protein
VDDSSFWLCSGPEEQNIAPQLKTASETLLSIIAVFFTPKIFFASSLTILAF